MKSFLIRSVYRTSSLITRRYLSGLPPHTVVGMPALSPTMSSGTIGKWTVKIGDKVSPGDSLAEVETDKANVTFESQDEFVIAKFLVAAGSEVKVGDPILVTVDDESAVSAFANFAVTAAPSTPASLATPPQVKEEPKVAAPPKVSTPPPAPVQKVSEPVSAPKVEVEKKSSKQPETVKQSTTTTAPFVYGAGFLKGALANKLIADQKEYLRKYGRSGYVPPTLPTKTK
jgi:pyruvate dehydrogenase E2 component (dihydrolipoamide acetyltransferase)